MIAWALLILLPLTGVYAAPWAWARIKIRRTPAAPLEPMGKKTVHPTRRPATRRIYDQETR
jgi:hypothetical protein